MSNDHREDIYRAGQRWTEAARFALAADRDELHAFTPWELCEHCGEAIERRDGRWVHGPTGDDGDYLAVCPTPLDTFAEPADECTECGEASADHCPDPDEYGDGLTGLLLDADVLTAPDDPERWRVELSLTVGGPTVYVVADSRWTSVTFHHSWGRDVHPDDVAKAADLHEIDLWGDDAAVWRDIAAQCAGADL